MLEAIPRPVGRWEKFAEAAARLGVPRDVLRAELAAAGSQIRSARLGKRGMHFVASADVDELARKLESGALA